MKMIIAAIAVIIGLLFFGAKDMLLPQNAPILQKKTITETPRTAEPMGRETRLFKQGIFTAEGKDAFRKIAFYFFQPQPPYPPKLTFPLVVVLHGAPGNSYAAQYLTSRKNVIDFPAFVVVPMIGTGSVWSAPGKSFPEKHRAMPEVMQLVGHVMKNYPVDPARVYVMGCSEGGYGAIGAMRDYGDVFAAGISISGGWAPSEAQHFLDKNLLVIHGAQDSLTPPAQSRNFAAAVKKLGGNKLIYSEIDWLNHECPLPALYGNYLWKWLFAQRKEATVIK